MKANITGREKWKIFHTYRWGDLKISPETRLFVTTRPFSNQTLSFPEVWIAARWRHFRSVHWGAHVHIIRGVWKHRHVRRCSAENMAIFKVLSIVNLKYYHLTLFPSTHYNFYNQMREEVAFCRLFLVFNDWLVRYAGVSAAPDEANTQRRAGLPTQTGLSGVWTSVS